MVTKNEDKPLTRTAELMKDAMAAEGLSINDLAKKVDVSYEHIANMLRPGSTTTPAARLLVDIAKALKLNLNKLKLAAEMDFIQKKNLDAGVKELARKNPELEPIERDFPKLTEEHKADVIAMVKMFAKRDTMASREQ